MAPSDANQSQNSAQPPYPALRAAFFPFHAGLSGKPEPNRVLTPSAAATFRVKAGLVPTIRAAPKLTFEICGWGKA
jgi:hypothetical protein